MPKISIIVPIYNTRKDFLDECIMSLQFQTLKDIEIILVDDGSKSEIALLCDEYAKSDDRIIVIHQDNQGVSVARNTGIEAAKSEWITFVDPDDWIELNTCERLMTFIENKDYMDILIFSYSDSYINKSIKRYWGDKSEYIFSQDEHKDLQLGLLDERKKYITVYFGAVWCNLYRKSFLDENRIRFIKELRKSQDTVFNLYAVEHAKKIGYLNEVLYHYRHNDSSVCHKYNPNIDNIMISLLSEIKIFIDKFKKNDEFEDAYKYKAIVTFIENMNLNYMHKENNKSVIKLKKDIKKLIKQDVYRVSINESKFDKLDRRKKIIIYLAKYNQILILKMFFILIQFKNSRKYKNY